MSAGAITAKQLADRLGVSPRTVQRWARERRVEHWRKGRTIRFLPHQVAAIEAAHTQAVEEHRPEVDVPNPMYEPYGELIPMRPDAA